MAYGTRSPCSSSSIFDGLTLSPLPYPVLLLLSMVLLLLSVSWFFNYEDMVEAAEEKMSWALLVAPVLLLVAIRWISSVRSFDELLGWYGYYDRRRRGYYDGQPQQDGSSPWGVAAVVILLLVLVYFQSSFQEMWGP